MQRRCAAACSHCWHAGAWAPAAAGACGRQPRFFIHLILSVCRCAFFPQPCPSTALWQRQAKRWPWPAGKWQYLLGYPCLAFPRAVHVSSDLTNVTCCRPRMLYPQAIPSGAPVHVGHLPRPVPQHLETILPFRTHDALRQTCHIPLTEHSMSHTQATAAQHKGIGAPCAREQLG